MRQIGHLPAGHARVFSDYLVAQGIRHEVDRENDGTYALWVHDEDQVAQAEELLKRFAANPTGAEYTSAGAAAEKARAREKEEQEAYRRRLHSRQRLFPQFGGYGVGIVTYGMIIASIILFVYTKMGRDFEALQPFLIADPSLRLSLGDVFAGPLWRLFTPIFLHFGLLHIVFNMMWLYQLGSMIEARRGSFHFIALVAFLAVFSNLAQLIISGRSYFGGMSGVVYGLAGYVWLRGKLDRASGLFLDTQSILILLVWQLICFTQIVGRIANWAHIGGLVAGLVVAWIASLLATRNPEH
jgi:Uncharacterized membrane protein (homolog of Drosophila rhomboid)